MKRRGFDDQSKIFTDLNKAGDLFGGALVQANTAFIPFSNLLKAIHLQEKPEFDPIAISSEGSVGHSALSLRKSEF